ncbi:hypothetical protein [Acinetobacter towneri]|uniref:Uncharacterized protein n=1 Tax=Acinetobacter towneri TaxID=202956 RepID=A0AAP9GUK6_9GAMM|nr:hypothetical protein [Acinetobacter towneri]QGM27369.1 hypothetical protein GJD93_06620 [Acinetobacter towneri]
MSDFEEYIKLNYPRDYERQKRIYPDQSVEDLYSEDYKMWQHQQAIIDSLKAQLKTWKGKSLAAMLHGTCKCGEPWQSIVSDREGFNLLHCFNCNIDRYENKEIFGDHEIKAMRGDE